MPSEVTQSDKRNNQTVELANGKERNLLGGMGLRDVTLAGVFPRDRNHAKGKNYTAIPTGHKCESIIENMMKRNNGVIRVVYTGRFSGTYTIEEFQHDPQPGGYIKYSILLKAYARPKLKIKRKKKSKKMINKKNKKIKKTKTARGIGRNNTTQVYFVKKGDTLSSIAKKITGDSSNYIAIANQNGIVSNPAGAIPKKKLVITIDN